MAKTYKKKTNIRKAGTRPKIKTWQMVSVVAIVALVGIYLVYKSFAGTDYVLKKTYKNTDSSVLITKDITQTTSSGGYKSVQVVKLTTDYVKLPSNQNNAVSYKFTLPVGEYRLCQQGQVVSETAVLEIGLLANGSDSTAGTIKKTFKKNEVIADLLCAEFSIPLNLPANAGEVEYIVKVSNDLANPTANTNINLSNFNIYVQNDINVGTSTRNNELHTGEKCDGERVISGQITDKLGKSVPAQIGIDFHYPDGYTGTIEKNTSTGYERLVYLNITDPQEKNKYWCTNIPNGVDKVSIESYSRTVYDYTGKLVNNALLFGDSQKHGIEVGDLKRKTIDLVLPNTCGSPNIPATVANTGQIAMKEINVNGEPIDLTPDLSEPKNNNLWRAIAWSRNLDPGETIAGYNALNTLQPHTQRADVINRLEPNQKYLTKFHVTRNKHDYKFEVPGVYVTGCKETAMSVDITDKKYGDYDSQLTCVARVKVPGKAEEAIDCSSIKEEKAKSLSL